MNKVLIAYLISCSFFHCIAMEKPLELRKFFIKNFFPDKVLIEYYLKNIQQKHSLQLVSGELKEIEQPHTIEKLFIVPYGEWKSLITRRFLGQELRNHQADLRNAVIQNPQNDLIMTIQSGVSKNIYFAAYIEQVYPYCVSIDAYLGKDHWARIPESWLLKDALPRVKEAIEKNEEILPRYILGVAADVSEEILFTAKKRLIEKWRPIAESAVPKEAAFGTELIEMVNSAYTTLVAEQKFKEFFKKEISGKK